MTDDTPKFSTCESLVEEFASLRGAGPAFAKSFYFPGFGYRADDDRKSESELYVAAASIIGRFGESGAENVGRILADTVKTMSEADEPGRRLGEAALEISIGRLFESLLDRPGIGRMLASAARKRIMEDRGDASPESSEGIRGILGL